MDNKRAHPDLKEREAAKPAKEAPKLHSINRTDIETETRNRQIYNIRRRHAEEEEAMISDAEAAMRRERAIRRGEDPEAALYVIVGEEEKCEEISVAICLFLGVYPSKSASF